MLRVLCGMLVLSSTLIATAPPLSDFDDIPNILPAADLPITRQHVYRMAGRVRLFLLWVAREDVGVGVITWREAGDKKAHELLIGSDPAKAPGRLNRWGYLVEETSGSEASIVGLISQDREERLSDVTTARQLQTRPFDTIRGRVGRADAHARVGTLYAPSALTLREAPAMLKLVLDDRSKPITQLPRPAGVRAGFLTAVSEFIAAGVTGPRGAEQPLLRKIQYVHGDQLYELRLLETIRVARYQAGGRTFDNVVRARFETALTSRRSGTRFELDYGTEGALAGIPIRVSYQPKWWLEVELFLQI